MRFHKKISIGSCSTDGLEGSVRSKLGAIGFRPVPKSVDTFERGSRLQTPFAMRPHQWYVNLALVRSDTGLLDITMNVKTTGQWVTREERAYFIALFRETCRASSRGTSAGKLAVLDPTTAVLERRAYRRNLRLCAGFCWLALGIGTLVMTQGFGLLLATLSGLSSATALLYAVIYGERFHRDSKPRRALGSDSRDDLTQEV
jgi:hypothetical protein